MSLIPNLIKRIEDIRVNPSEWVQKFSIIEFKDKKGKNYWNKSYNFLPKWERYKEAKDWIKNTDFPEYNCKITWNANNEIEITTQNYFGESIFLEQKEKEILGKIKKKIHEEINNPTIELEAEQDIKDYQQELKEGLKLTTYEELSQFYYADLFDKELEQLKKVSQQKGASEEKKEVYDLGRYDLAILWKKQLYFITSFTYVNNYKLYVVINAKKCLLSIKYYDWISSPGQGIIEKAPNLIKDTSDKWEDNQRLHYDFCGDLGIKKIVQQAFSSYQPKFQLFRAQVRYDGAKRNITWSEQVPTGRNAEPKQLSIPSDIRLSKFGEKEANEASKGWLKETALMTLIKLRAVVDSAGAFRQLGQMLLDAKMVLTIGPTEMTDLSKAFFSKMEEYEEELFTNNSTFTKWLKEQSHLWDHTTFQFYLFNKITMTANGRYLGIKEKDGKFILPYKLFINYSPGNLYYRWEFKYITVKCEISNEGSFEDWTNPARVMRGFNIKLGGKILASGGSFGFGMNWADTGEEAGKIKQGEDPAAEQEAQTERMFKNTFRNFNDKSVEPAMFNANTIDFHYSLGEFFNRLTDPIFFYRAEISELLKNRLDWANNKSHQLNLPLSWKEIGTWTQKPGLWKWNNVSLQKDTNNFFTNIMNKGYWLDDGKDLKNPKLSFAHASSSVQIGGNAWNISSAEEELIEKKEIIEEDRKVASGDVNQKEWGHGTWIRPTNSEEMSNFLTLGSPFSHPDPNNGFCWGCSGYVGSPGTYTPSQDTNIEFVLDKSNTSNRQIATCKAGVSYQVRVEQVGNELQVFFKSREERTTWETKIKKDPNPIKNEIDQEQLENEVEDEKVEEMEQEDEEVLKELGADKEKEAEPEKEPEREQEQETEQETEQEKEEEIEKEDENEKEGEKETEKENEQEEEQEEEKQEHEEEDEEEREI